MITRTGYNPEDLRVFGKPESNTQTIPEPMQTESRYYRKDGRERWTGYVCQPVISLGGIPAGRRDCTRDNTKRKNRSRDKKKAVEMIEKKWNRFQSDLIVV